MALFGGFTVDHADFRPLTIDCTDILQYNQAVKFAYACATSRTSDSCMEGVDPG